jgi:hypothetical protein
MGRDPLHNRRVGRCASPHRSGRCIRGRGTNGRCKHRLLRFVSGALHRDGSSWAGPPLAIETFSSFRADQFVVSFLLFSGFSFCYSVFFFGFYFLCTVFQSSFFNLGKFVIRANFEFDFSKNLNSSKF